MRIIWRTPHLELSLEENALESLREGLSRLKRSAEEPWSANEPTSVQLKYAVLHTAHAVELFLKARLAKEHRLLVFSDPAKDSATSRTVGCEAALARLTAAGVETSKDEASYVRTIRRLRNQLEHGPVSLPESELYSAVGRAFNFLERFCSAELGLSLEDELPGDSYFVARKAGLDYEEALKLAEARVNERLEALPQADRGKHQVLECPDCGNRTLIYPNPDLLPRNRIQCYACQQWQTYNPDVSESFPDPYEYY